MCSKPKSSERTDSAPAAIRPGAAAALRQLVLAGFLSMLGQVTVLREIAVTSYGVELTSLAALAAWMTGAGLGAMLRRRKAPSPAVVRGLLATFAGLLPAQLAFIRIARLSFGAVPGAYLPPAQQAALLAAGVVPVAALGGWLFQTAARRFLLSHGTLAGAYGWECAGSTLGGLVSTALPALGVSNLAAGCLTAAVAAAAVGSTRGERIAIRLGSLGLAGLALVAAINSRPLDFHLSRLHHPDLVAVRDTPYARVAVTGRLGQYSIFSDDQLAGETFSIEPEQFVHPAAVQRETMGRVLVLGGGWDQTITELLRHEPRQVDVVEIDRRAFLTVREYLPHLVRSSLEDPRVRLHFADPRRFLDRVDGSGYDLILIAVPESASGATNRLYTRDFFRLCRRVMTESGVLSLRLRSAENLWTPLLAAKVRSVYGALRDTFSSVVILPGTDALLLASPTPLCADGDSLVHRLERRGLQTKLVTPDYLRYLYRNDRFVTANRIAAEGHSLVNRDARPVCYQLAAMLYISKFFPRLGRATVSELALWSGLAAVFITGVAVYLARRTGLRRSLIAAAAGFAGMALQTSVLLYYQAKQGALFYNIGLLFTAFMVGLAAGGAWANRLVSRGGGLRPRLARQTAATLMLLSAISAAHYQLSLGMSLPSAWFYLAASGFLTAALFAYSGGDSQTAPRVLATVYAADLAGGALACLVCPLFIIPLFGLVPASVLAGGLSALIWALTRYKLSP